ncbi:hypothetical protein DSO57_1024626, partial [Entomophthora muscae]
WKASNSSPLPSLRRLSGRMTLRCVHISNLQSAQEPVSIDNSLPLETQAQGRDLNPEPEFLRAAGPMDQEPPAVFC